MGALERDEVEALAGARSGPEREFELKFPLPLSRAAVLAQWMRTYCVPHPHFHETHISSIYYDTADWRLLNEKIASDYFKSKVRLRWYRTPPGAAPAPVFIEAKIKEGGQRLKLRSPVPGLTVEEVEATPLHAPLFEEPLRLLAEKHLPLPGGVTPVFEIAYRRLRFLHRFSPSVFCLDREIRVPRVHQGRLRYAAPMPDPFAVLEQKGPLEDLDPIFRVSGHFRLQKRAFSKYMSMFFRLTDKVH